MKFSFPNYFNVVYDSNDITQEQMLSLDVFVPYPATITEGAVLETVQQPTGCSRCGGCSGACGGTCGG